MTTFAISLIKSIFIVKVWFPWFIDLQIVILSIYIPVRLAKANITNGWNDEVKYIKELFCNNTMNWIKYSLQCFWADIFKHKYEGMIIILIEHIDPVFLRISQCNISQLFENSTLLNHFFSWECYCTSIIAIEEFLIIYLHITNKSIKVFDWIISKEILIYFSQLLSGLKTPDKSVSCSVYSLALTKWFWKEKLVSLVIYSLAILFN